MLIFFKLHVKYPSIFQLKGATVFKMIDGSLHSRGIVAPGGVGGTLDFK